MTNLPDNMLWTTKIENGCLYFLSENKMLNSGIICGSDKMAEKLLLAIYVAYQKENKVFDVEYFFKHNTDEVI
jgi:hypothetical protein